MKAACSFSHPANQQNTASEYCSEPMTPVSQAVSICYSQSLGDTATALLPWSGGVS